MKRARAAAAALAGVAPGRSGGRRLRLAPARARVRLRLLAGFLGRHVRGFGERVGSLVDFYRMLWPTAAIEKDVAPKRVSSNLTRPLAAAAKTLRQASELPQEVQDASRGAATDAARRTVRLNYLAGLLDT